jgi:hypothetical protein
MAFELEDNPPDKIILSLLQVFGDLTVGNAVLLEQSL